MPSIEFIEGKQVLERKQKYNANDFILKTNGQLILEDEYLNTDEVGIFSHNYTVKKLFFKRNIAYSYEVVDTTGPIISFKQTLIKKDPGDALSKDDMMSNIILDEGSAQIKTDYNPNVSGTYFVNVEAIDDYDNKSEASFEIFVNDIEPPDVFRTADGKEVLQYSNFNVMDVISYGDNVDPKPSVTIKGSVNTNVLGSYPLSATITDFSGNSTSFDFTIEVVSEYSHEDDPDFYYYEDFKDEYAAGNRRFGIDVSEWQYDIDFEKVKKAGCEFVFMRLGFSHEGALTIDKKFKQNFEGFKKVGIPIGIYVFFYENNKEDLIKVIDQVCEVLDGQTIDLPFAFDWENFDHYQEYEISFQQLNKLYDVFKEEVNKRGFDSILYGSTYYMKNIWNNTDKSAVWLAQYADWPTYNDSYQFWQVSAFGKIDGIDGYCDFDILFLNE